MHNPSENSNSESKPTGIGIGERLQAARIQQGLSVEDIATRMHLNAQIVKSIEDNNFDDITAPIFVKGYLRAYARIVSLDEEELIQQYANYYSHEDPPISTTSNMAPELSVADVRIKWTTYLVILGLAALLAAWWWNKNQNEATPISLDSQRASDTVAPRDADTGGQPARERPSETSEPGMTESPAPAESVAGEATTAEPVAGEPAASQPEVAETNLPAAPEPVAPPADAGEPAAPPAETAEAQAPAAESSGGTAGESRSETPAVAANEPAQDTAPAAPEPAAEAAPAKPRIGAPILVAPTGSDVLTLTITADTWVDIKDGNDFQMVYHLLRAGQSLKLTGSAPFSVFLGNGPGVEIQFNGKPIEFSARIRSDNTARLKIGS